MLREPRELIQEEEVHGTEEAMKVVTEEATHKASEEAMETIKVMEAMVDLMAIVVMKAPKDLED